MGDGGKCNHPVGDKALRDIGDCVGIKAVTPKKFLTLQDLEGSIQR